MATVQIADMLGRKKLSLAFDEGPGEPHPIGLVEPSPCTRACPAGVNVKAYVSLIATGRFHEALEVVRKEVRAWQEFRNNKNAKINWQLTNEEARIRLSRLYPTYDS